MSWTINIVGERGGVKRRLLSPKIEIDKPQAEVVRNFLIPAIDALPESVEGIHVKASGHRDDHTYQLIIKLQPVQLALDNDAKPPEEIAS